MSQLHGGHTYHQVTFISKANTDFPCITNFPWKVIFPWKFPGSSTEVPRKFHGSSTEVPRKFHGSSLEVPRKFPGSMVNFKSTTLKFGRIFGIFFILSEFCYYLFLLHFLQRHSRFGGTFYIKNLKSISDRDVIYHSAVQHSNNITFDQNKEPKKKPKNRMPMRDTTVTRRYCGCRIL